MRQGRNSEMLRMFRFQGWLPCAERVVGLGIFRISRDSAFRLDVAVKTGP